MLTQIRCREFRVRIHVWTRLFEPRHDKTNKVTVRPAKTQISLGIRLVLSESSLSAWRNLGSLATHWAHSEDSDQTGRIPRLIWVFAGRTPILLVLSCCGSVEPHRALCVPTCPHRAPFALSSWSCFKPPTWKYERVGIVLLACPIVCAFDRAGQRGQQYQQLPLGPVPEHWLRGKLPGGQNYV